MEITMDLIKTLREKCGAGISDCKKALDEASGDINKAVEILRKKGIAKAAKRGDRKACEGVILVATNNKGKEGYIVEINSETDFVARNERFKEFANKILEIIETKKPNSLDELMVIHMANGTIRENLDNLSGTIGEKLDIKGFDVLSSPGTVAAYSHMGGRIGVLVALDKSGKEELAQDIAMQVAASNPKYITPEDVPEEEKNKEKEIYVDQLKKEGKPDNIIKKIVEGKLNKYYQQVCLLEQEYIKDDTKKLKHILRVVKVAGLVRYSL
jgi:elongation factor Ts